EVGVAAAAHRAGDVRRARSARRARVRGLSAPRQGRSPALRAADQVTTVHHLNCATMCPIAGWLMGAKGWRGLMVAHCLLVETERDGLVLVDSGFGTRDLEGKTGLPRMFKSLVGPTLDPAEPAIAQVVALGFKPEDVRHVVVTHLDLDHAGGIADFPHAKVHLHQREHIAATTRPTRR